MSVYQRARKQNRMRQFMINRKGRDSVVKEVDKQWNIKQENTKQENI